jgi:protein-S-isoprenylcysteine O-methyltransferase Ste14
LDTILALQFAILHSLLLWPPVRKRLNRWAPNSFYGLAFTTVSSLSLLLLFANWRSFGPVIWQVDGVLATIISVAYHVSFLALGYSMWITGLGHQTGTTAWLAWWRGTKPTPRAFAPQGAYRFLRHPIYFSMGGLIWFTPTMTLDHALLTGLWTAYLLIGSWIKDERLAFFIGGPYREYQQRVPGFPGMPRGVLGRRTP